MWLWNVNSPMGFQRYPFGWTNIPPHLFRSTAGLIALSKSVECIEFRCFWSEISNSKCTPGRVNQVSQITSTAWQPHKWCMWQCHKSIQISYDHVHFLRIQLHPWVWEVRRCLAVAMTSLARDVNGTRVWVNADAQIGYLLLLELAFPLISHWATSEPHALSQFSLRKQFRTANITERWVGVQASAKGNDFEWYIATRLFVLILHCKVISHDFSGCKYKWQLWIKNDPSRLLLFFIRES